ncbi:MAG: hypothetical protein PHC88_10145 [Terrimicrobiaceae bacterium]|nr:hypothetical protein [Terrimicrobiaceae bacterium]
MRTTIGATLIRAARISFLVHIVAAAAAYGLTRESGIHWFNLGLGVTVSAWLLGSLLAGVRPRAGWIPVGIAGGILALGWTVTGLSSIDPTTGYEGPAPDWLTTVAAQIGAFDADLAWSGMLRVTALLAAFLFAIDMFRQPMWTRMALMVVGVTGIGMVTLFYLGKIVPAIFELKALDETNPLAFATFRYWGNAASFLNLVWPVLAGIALHIGLNRGRGWSIWMGGALWTFSALYVNLSKAGQVLGIIGLLLLGGLFLGILIRRGRLHRNRFSWRLFLAALLPALIFLGALPFAIPWQRWEGLAGTGLEQNQRTQAYRLFIQVVPQSGWTGFGPHTFQDVSWNYFSDEAVVRTTPFWVAHQDYLQTLIEWGYAGTLLWACLLIPPAIRLLAGSLGKRGNPQQIEENGYQFTLWDHFRSFATSLPAAEAPALQAGVFVAIALTALHAAVDFPMQIESLQFYFLIWTALGWSLCGPREANAASERG